MTAHELAKYLLELPDLPVMMEGSGSDEGTENDVDGVYLDKEQNRLFVGYFYETNEGDKRWFIHGFDKLK